jgi:heme-degrading monooxygenase HmoA
MIARTWRGRVPAARAAEYYEFLLRTGVADYRATPGNRGVIVQQRIEGNEAQFVLTTFWDSADSIKTFAGEDYERARYYPEDDEYLLDRETYVTHAEVLLMQIDAPDSPALRQAAAQPAGL